MDNTTLQVFAGVVVVFMFFTMGYLYSISGYLGDIARELKKANEKGK